MSTTTRTIVPVSVEVKKYDDDGGFYGEVMYSVSPVWADVDRPNVGGIVVHAKDVTRLTAAYLAGVVFSSTEVRTDVDGQTYVCGRSKVSGRHLNADLKALGY